VPEKEKRDIMDPKTLDFFIGSGVAALIGALLIAFVYLIVSNREKSRVIKSLQETILTQESANKGASDLLLPYFKKFWINQVLSKIAAGKIPSSELKHAFKMLDILYKIASRVTINLLHEIQLSSWVVKTCNFNYDNLTHEIKITVCWDGLKRPFEHSILK
jgi:hypothetical protein